jgi:hypothetical protein
VSKEEAADITGHGEGGAKDSAEERKGKGKGDGRMIASLFLF